MQDQQRGLGWAQALPGSLHSRLSRLLQLIQLQVGRWPQAHCSTTNQSTEPSPNGVQTRQLCQVAAALVVKWGAAGIQLCQLHQPRQPAKLPRRHLQVAGSREQRASGNGVLGCRGLNSWPQELAASISMGLTGSPLPPYPPHVATRAHLIDNHSQAGQLGEAPQEGRAAGAQPHA